MKNFRTTMLCVCMSILGLQAFAQNQDVPPLNQPDYNKPKLFAAYPEQIPVNMAVINNLFSAPLGTAVDFNISDATTFRFAGELISSVSKYENKIRSVVVRSTNFNGARLFISKISNDDGSFSYTGRLISKEYGDVYELQPVNNQFALVKRGYYDLVTE